MITSVRSVGINTGDQDKAKRFWTGTMGFELIMTLPWANRREAPAGSR